MKDEKTEEEYRHIPSPTTGLLALVGVILFCLSLILVFVEFNRVGNVTFEVGSYAEEEAVREIVGDVQGDLLAFMDTDALKKEISALSPMIADVNIELRFPRRLYVQVIDEECFFYMRGTNGVTLLLNRDFKILGIHDEEAYEAGECHYDLNGMTELFVSEPSAPAVGKQLDFTGKESLSEFLPLLYEKKGDLYRQLNILDLRNLRGVVVVFDRLVRMEISDTTAPASKFEALAAMMAEKKVIEEDCPSRFVYVKPRTGSSYWAVSFWTNIFD